MSKRVSYEDIVQAMGKGSHSTREIAEKVGLKPETARRKLHWMKALGLVRTVSTPWHVSTLIWAATKHSTAAGVS